MSLSSLTGTGQNILRGATQPAATQQVGTVAVPGTPSGAAPSHTPSLVQHAQATNLNPAAPDTASDPLAAYARKPDTVTSPNQPANPAQPAQQQQAPAPKLEDFAGVVDTLSQNIQIDDAMAANALRGDPASLKTLLQSVVKQTMQHSLFASTAAAQHLASTSVDQATNVVTNRVNQTQAHQAAINAAVADNPQLASGLHAKLLETAITELRTQYPTAPAELLGKEAARRLNATSGNSAQATAQAEGTDWLKELQFGQL